MNKRNPASSKPVECLWYELFEASYAEETCEKIKNQMCGPHIRGGTSPEGLSECCRKYLLIPLDQYIAEHRRPDIRGIQAHIEAAESMVEVVASIRSRLETSDQPVTEAEADLLTFRLLFFWYGFIAHGAGPSIYDTLPKKKAQAKKAATKKRGNGRELTVQHVVKFMRDRGLSTLSNTDAEEVAKLHPADSKGTTVSARTVQRRLKEARERGLLPQTT